MFIYQLNTYAFVLFTKNNDKISIENYSPHDNVLFKLYKPRKGGSWALVILPGLDAQMDNIRIEDWLEVTDFPQNKCNLKTWINERHEGDPFSVLVVQFSQVDKIPNDINL